MFRAALSGLAAVATVAAASTAPAKSPAPRYLGYPCPDPVGHKVTQCRLGIHGTPDLSRRAWAKTASKEVTVSAAFRELNPNPARGGAREWPVVDSLGQQMGTLRQTKNGKRRLLAADGQDFSVVAMNVRGHGCAASNAQMATQTLAQIIAPKAPGHGTQGFLAIDAVADDAARRAFTDQLGGGTGCGPSGTRRGKARPLADPAVGAAAHARLSNGTLNSVTEYDAKPAFGRTIYVMTNTTSVRVGGITRAIVRAGTPVQTVDRFRRCDPNSDGTLTWRYLAISTAGATGPIDRRYLYGWVPTRCPARMR
ncbi:MAG: hypothetical protein J7513_01605 [Solirubrobacteraceae bacterium]|nr:hypothetical protein [Solirubrobacteraceae bacterium]